MFGIRGLEEAKRLDIWRAREIREVQEWDVGVRIAGAFQVADVGIIEEERGGHGEQGVGKSRDDGSELERETYVDFVYGADVGFLRGVHRFSVLRRKELVSGERDQEDEEKEALEIRFACVACNPEKSKPLKPEWLARFHLLYSMLLFRDGVTEVLASDR